MFLFLLKHLNGTFVFQGLRDCLILSVGQFDNDDNRGNAQKDASLLRTTFSELNFRFDNKFLSFPESKKNYLKSKDFL